MDTNPNFIKILKSTTDIPDEQIKKIVAISQFKKVNRGNYFLKEGEIPNQFAFVIQGLFRYYYSEEKGGELTKGFILENSFLGAYSALIQNRGSYFSIQALEDSSIIVIDYKKWLKLQKEDPCWNLFLISLLEKGFCIKEARERELLLLDAEARYRSFLSSFPELEKRIKQNLIASYLRITPVGLSRVRKKMGLT